MHVEALVVLLQELYSPSTPPDIFLGPHLLPYSICLQKCGTRLKKAVVEAIRQQMDQIRIVYDKQMFSRWISPR